MNLKQFADLCGCKIVPCSEDWDGKYGYTSDDMENCTINGFKTKNEARKYWLEDNFGHRASEVIMTLLEEQV